MNETILHPENGRPRSRKRLLKWTAVAAVLVAASLGWRLFGKTDAPTYTAAPLVRGDVAQTITATGALQAVVTVQVGSQVSGTLSAINVDFNSRVKKGDVIARIDPSLFQAKLEQAKGNLASAQAALETARNSVTNAEAAVASAGANLKRTTVARDDAARAHKRLTELSSTGAVSTREVEAAEATLEQAEAQFQQAAAQLDQAKAQLLSERSRVNQASAQVKQTQAAVQLAAVDVNNTIIRSPIDGVVIARNVDAGQTVAASFQAPVLFLIANDLTQMQVLASIDEADVGQLTPESKVTFTVDAYPRDAFRGTVSQIRLNPETVQNVVTYTAVIDVHNPELKLKPGMTANVTATVAERNDVLKAPNAALRFRPVAAPQAENDQRPSGARRQQVLWKLEKDGKLRPVPVTVGLSDGTHSEIASNDLQPGDHVAIGQSDAKSASAAARNPMMPFGGRGGRR